MGLWTLTKGQQSETPGLYIGLKTLFSFRYFNIPLKMKDDPFRLIGVIGSIQVKKSVVHPIFSCCVSQSQAQRFVTGALQLYPEHTENLLRSFWMRSWGEQKVWTMFKCTHHSLGFSGWCDPCLLPKFNLKKMKSLICPESTKNTFTFFIQVFKCFSRCFHFFNAKYPIPRVNGSSQKVFVLPFQVFLNNRINDTFSLQ